MLRALEFRQAQLPHIITPRVSLYTGNKNSALHWINCFIVRTPPEWRSCCQTSSRCLAVCFMEKKKKCTTPFDEYTESTRCLIVQYPSQHHPHTFIKYAVKKAESTWILKWIMYSFCFWLWWDLSETDSLAASFKEQQMSVMFFFFSFKT